MMLTDTLTRLKKNRSFQLGKLTDKGTSEPLLKPEHVLSQLQRVFDGVQMALRGGGGHGAQYAGLPTSSTLNRTATDTAFVSRRYQCGFRSSARHQKSFP